MTDVDYDGDTESARSGRGGGMRVPRSRGVVSGVLLVLAGAWAAFVPFVGPSFDFAYTPKPGQTWHWTAARGWFEVLPGGLAVLGGLLLILSASRIVTILGAWLAAAAGGWLVVGQQVAYLLTLGSPGGPAAKGDRRYVAEYLAFFTGIGALIILFAAIAVGRLSVRSVRDVRAAERRDEQAALAEQEATEREQRERDDYERAYADRGVTDRNADTWAAGGGPAASAATTQLPAAGYRDDEVHARQDQPGAHPDDDTAAMPVVPPADRADSEPQSNPTVQSSTTTSELPAVDQAPPPSAPAADDAADPPADTTRRMQLPRRYFGSGSSASQDERDETDEPATRDAVRTDEADDLDDMDLDERTR